MGSVAGATHHQHTHFRRFTLSAALPAGPTGIVFGHLPAGARITNVDVYVETAFNNAAAINVGYIPEVSGTLLAPITPQTQLVNGGPGGATGLTKTPPPGLTGIASTDLALIASLSAAATVGAATIIVSYVPNL